MSSFPSPSPSLVSDNKHGLYRTDNTLTQPYMVTIHQHTFSCDNGIIFKKEI